LLVNLLKQLLRALNRLFALAYLFDQFLTFPPKPLLITSVQRHRLGRLPSFGGWCGRLLALCAVSPLEIIRIETDEYRRRLHESRRDLAETIAMTRKSIDESQALIAEVDAVIAMRWHR
jgi:hypothetical protein